MSAESDANRLALIMRAQRLAREGKHSEALAAYRQVLSGLAPGSELWQEVSSAIQALEPAQPGQGGEEATVLLARGQRLEQQGNLTAALAAYDKALSLTPAGSPLYSELQSIVGDLKGRIESAARVSEEDLKADTPSGVAQADSQADTTPGRTDGARIAFSFKGRIGRQTFWVSLLIANAVGYGLSLIWNSGLSGSDTSEATIIAIGVLSLILLIVLVWVNLAIQVKRWHDLDKSGWWVLINLIPVIGGLWALIELGFVKGTAGPNRFGEDPLTPVVESVQE